MKVKPEKLQKYPSGALRSNRRGKGRFDLISPFALMRLAKVYEEGGYQKGDRNWEKGFQISRAIDSAERHINQYKMGWTDEDHLANAAWQLFCAMHFECVLPEMYDLPNYVKEKK